MVTTTLNKSDRLVDSFKLPNLHWDINESETAHDPRVDGTNVLARVVGPFFLINNESLNGRFYTRALWEKCINKMSEKLNAGGLPGTVGHDNGLDENAILNGKISHVVSRLWVDDKNGVGMGEMLILNTSAGRELNTMLRAGIQLPVSSRAYGKINGKTSEGADLIDEDSFILETFDFVTSPGVPSAVPKVVESHPTTPIEDTEEMSEKLITEKLELAEKLTKANQAIQEAQDQHKKLAEQNDKLKKAIGIFEQHICTLDKVAQVREGLMKYLYLEPTKTLAKDMDLFKTGGLSVGDMVKTLTESAPQLSKFVSPEAHKAITDKLAKHEEIGSIEEMEALIKVVETYAKLGKPSEVQARVNKAKKFENIVRNWQRQIAAKKIGTKFDCPPEMVAEMLKAMPVKGVVNTLRKLRESKALTERYEVKTSGSKPSLQVVEGGSAAKSKNLASMFDSYIAK